MADDICERSARGEPHCAISGDINTIARLPVGHKYGICKRCYERSPAFFEPYVSNPYLSERTVNG
jgi:hypothetical protein